MASCLTSILYHTIANTSCIRKPATGDLPGRRRSPLYLSFIFTAVRARTGTSRGFFLFLFSGSCSQETSMWYHMIREVVFVVFWGTLLRPTAGAVVLIPKCTTLQSVPWLCASIQEESYAISLWLSTATSAVNIALSGGATASSLKLRIRYQRPRARNYRQLGILSSI